MTRHATRPLHVTVALLMLAAALPACADSDPGIESPVDTDADRPFDEPTGSDSAPRPRTDDDVEVVLCPDFEPYPEGHHPGPCRETVHEWTASGVDAEFGSPEVWEIYHEYDEAGRVASTVERAPDPRGTTRTSHRYTALADGLTLEEWTRIPDETPGREERGWRLRDAEDRVVEEFWRNPPSGGASHSIHSFDAQGCWDSTTTISNDNQDGERSSTATRGQRPTGWSLVKLYEQDPNDEPEILVPLGERMRFNRFGDVLESASSTFSRSGENQLAIEDSQFIRYDESGNLYESDRISRVEYESDDGLRSYRTRTQRFYDYSCWEGGSAAD